MALEARSSRRAWIDQGRPIFEEVRSKFESEQELLRRINGDLLQPEGLVRRR
jgi:hypothetical protein